MSVVRVTSPAIVLVTAVESTDYALALTTPIVRASITKIFFMSLMF